MLSYADAKNTRSISVVTARRRRLMNHEQQQILFGERSVRKATAEFMAHYHSAA